MVLVTGGAGFIGSHIVRELLDRGRDVRVLDRADGVRDPRADNRVGDVRDPVALAAALAGVRAVCHQAAKVGLEQGSADMPAYVDDNCLGTARLLAALADRPVQRIVLASSMVVYGEGRYRCPAHGIVRPPPRALADLDAGRFEPRCASCGSELAPEPIPETARLDPRNAYAATKLHQEHLASAFSRQTGVPVVALRYHNVYGPGMPRDTAYAGVAARFADQLARGLAPQVLEDGGQLRDFVHVRDVARANVLALEAGASGPLNICSGTPRSILALATAMSPEREPMVTGAYRRGDVRHVFAAAERARTVLGFAAREAFDPGVTVAADAGPVR